jgi:hypothetical protein
MLVANALSFICVFGAANPVQPSSSKIHEKISAKVSMGMATTSVTKSLAYHAEMHLPIYL